MQGSTDSTSASKHNQNRDNEWINSIRHRLLGDYVGNESGPLLAVVACLHGNEISGADAALRVLTYLNRSNLPLRGRLIALLGNVPAYDARLRFIEEDLNRIWTADRVQHALSNKPMSVEEGQLVELRHALDHLSELDYSGRFLLDLHTTSAASPPFVAHAGNGRAREIVKRIGAIEVRKITDYLGGMLVKHSSEIGWNSIAFEAGSHMQADSVDIHETLIWQALATADMIVDEDLPLRIRMRQEELKRPEMLQPTVEVVHHHVIKDGDRFRMRHGYRNFQSIEYGEFLAEDRSGRIHAPVSGRIFLPLYQDEGRDGFFIVKDQLAETQEDAA